MNSQKLTSQIQLYTTQKKLIEFAMQPSEIVVYGKNRAKQPASVFWRSMETMMGQRFVHTALKHKKSAESSSKLVKSRRMALRNLLLGQKNPSGSVSPRFRMAFQQASNDLSRYRAEFAK